MENVIRCPHLAQSIFDCLQQHREHVGRSTRRKTDCSKLSRASKTFHRSFAPLLYRDVYLAPGAETEMNEPRAHVRAVEEWQREHFECVQKLEFDQRWELKPCLEVVAKCTNLRRLILPLAPAKAHTSNALVDLSRLESIEHMTCIPGDLALARLIQSSTSLRTLELRVGTSPFDATWFGSPCTARRLRLQGALHELGDIRLSIFAPEARTMELVEVVDGRVVNESLFFNSRYRRVQQLLRNLHYLDHLSIFFVASKSRQLDLLQDGHPCTELVNNTHEGKSLECWKQISAQWRGDPDFPPLRSICLATLLNQTGGSESEELDRWQEEGARMIGHLAGDNLLESDSLQLWSVHNGRVDPSGEWHFETSKRIVWSDEAKLAGVLQSSI